MMEAHRVGSMAARNKLLDRFFRRADDGSVYFVWNASDEEKEKVAHILERAAYHWRRGELDQALEQAEAALRLSPSSPVANEIAAVYAIEADKPDQLRHLFERMPQPLRTLYPFIALSAVAMAYDGNDSDARILLGRLSEQYGNHSYSLFAKAEIAYHTRTLTSAADSYQSLYRLHPDFQYGHIHAARVFLALDDASTAIQLLEQRLQTQPRNAEVYFLFGCSYEKIGDNARARQQYREALSIQPDRSDAHFRLGRLERKARQFPAATQHLRYAFGLNPDSVEIARELFTLYVETKQWDEAEKVLSYLFRPSPTDDDVRLILTAFDQGAQFDSLEALVADALMENLHDPVLLFLWGYVLYRNKRYTEAQQALEAATKLEQRTDTWLCLARVYAALNLNQQALDAYARVLELDRKNIAAFKERCQLRIRLEQTKDALNDVEAAIALSPDIGELYYLRAICHYDLGEENKALESLTLALQRDPSLSDAWVMSSQLWRARGEYAQAIYALKQVLAVNPDDIQAHTAMAETQLAIGRINAAKQHIAQIIKHNPEKGEEVYLMLGKSLEKRNLFNQALDLYEDALLYYPSSVELRFRCGVAALKSGALHICSRQIEELSASDPIRASTLRDVYNLMLQSKR